MSIVHYKPRNIYMCIHCGDVAYPGHRDVQRGSEGEHCPSQQHHKHCNGCILSVSQLELLKWDEGGSVGGREGEAVREVVRVEWREGVKEGWREGVKEDRGRK